ncbi:DUF2079 domain-containing protein [Streptomyces sp. NBC_00557]|uniref:DUF2079 domain-containing protein n=1 Tax=Streptomyces sp. NBC_00557 TaxID=2975776 RepID=UPI002E81A638|nr:DUF2079 domain-containing protein [Streptomyces sp. NBC_00557]WUC35038.1 DUF2079 domain-containing protein [Streptomyces sp. NBC_00557]
MAGPPRKGRFDGTWWVWALAGALFVMYAAVSLRLHQQMLTSSYDLGIFQQVVRSYAEGHLPVSEVKGQDFPVLGDHFSPILALVAPFYLVWRHAETLLAVQAALLAVSVVPLTLWARRALGSVAGAVIGACYGLSWGIASAVGYDFHEVAFAAPLLALSLTALGNGRLTAAACWALPLLLVKEDLGLTVLVIGLVIARRGNRRLGTLTAVAGVAGTALALFVILPAFNPGGSFAYWSLLQGSDAGGQGVAEGSSGGLPHVLYQGTIGLFTPLPKVTTFVLMLAPTLFLALRSPLLWIALPTLVWRFASNNGLHWGTSFHYSLVLMPIVFAAFVDALVRRGTSGRGLRRYLAASAAITLMILPSFPLFEIAQPETWRTDSRVTVARRLIAMIPDGVTVQASDHLVPQLADRTSVGLYGAPGSRPDPQWVMVDTEVPPEQRAWPGQPLSVEEEQQHLAADLAHGYELVSLQDGYMLLHRRTAPRGSGRP